MKAISLLALSYFFIASLAVSMDLTGIEEINYVSGDFSIEFIPWSKNSVEVEASHQGLKKLIRLTKENNRLEIKVDSSDTLPQHQEIKNFEKRIAQIQELQTSATGGVSIGCNSTFGANSSMYVSNVSAFSFPDYSKDIKKLQQEIKDICAEGKFTIYYPERIIINQ